MNVPDTIDLGHHGPRASDRGTKEPEEVAARFAVVASDEASGIHGAIPAE